MYLASQQQSSSQLFILNVVPALSISTDDRSMINLINFGIVPTQIDCGYKKQPNLVFCFY